MNNIKLEIDNYYDLLNLHKALLEAKFHQNPDNENVAGSPIIARISNDILDLLDLYELKYNKSNKVNSWKEWRKISNHRFYKERAINRIVQCEEWNNLDESGKKQTIMNYLSPFTCTDNQLLDIMVEIQKLIEL